MEWLLGEGLLDRKRRRGERDGEWGLGGGRSKTLKVGWSFPVPDVSVVPEVPADLKLPVFPVLRPKCCAYRADEGLAHIGRAAEADLSLCRVDIDIHTVSGQRERQDDKRELMLHDKCLICFFNGTVDYF